MPNLNPAPDTPATLGEQLEIIRRDAVVRVKPYGTITMGQRGCGELVDFRGLGPAGRRLLGRRPRRAVGGADGGGDAPGRGCR